MKKFVVWFKEVDKHDLAIVGGKGANLGEMTKAGFPVPNGFIVTSHAYYEFIDQNHLRETIHTLLHNVNVNNSDELDKAAKKIQQTIKRAPMPDEIAKDVIKAYFSLDKGLIKHAKVAVRSSATAEDLPGASFAGQQETYLNVVGEANVLEKIRECWASLYTARAIFYRESNKFDHFKIGIAVPVQRMVESDASGIMFTIDPVTNDKTKVVIEAIFGLGEMIVQGKVTPDHYEVDKVSKDIFAKTINTQEKLMRQKGTDNEIISLTKDKGSKQKINEKEILALAELGIKLEKHYYFPQDSEWAIENGKVYIVQTRPVTTAANKVQTMDVSSIKREVLLKGDPASPGMACGKVQILKSAKEINKIEKGEVLVAEQTNPDFVPAMKKASAIITERGGRTSHAAIVSRELGIPAIVGCKDVLSTLKDGQMVTVNGTKGEVYKGGITDAEKKAVLTANLPAAYTKTATKILVNLAEPSRAVEIAKKHVDGVGLLRAEFMIADIGTHPKKMIAEGKSQQFIDELSEKIAVFCKAFTPRPVIYRATDFKTNEYRNLRGGKEFEPEEPNPMLGFRGAARYIADPKVFELELEAIKKVRNKMGLKNLHLMIPFVRTPQELLGVKKIIAGKGLTRSQAFKLYLMCEIPANVIRMDEFIEVGIDGISIGSNDLTMLTLGTDRDNSEVAHDFNELDPSVLWMLEHAIKMCAVKGVTASICGQAPSDYPELVEKLVKWGITSISVNPDAVDSVRHTASLAEKKIVTRK